MWKLAALMLFCFSIDATAFDYGEATIDLQPASPPANALVSVVASAPPGTCLTFAVIPRVDVPARTIVVILSSFDSGPPQCPATRVPPQMVSIGPLPRGMYQVEYRACAGSAPPPGPQCIVVANEIQQVGGGDPVQVPGTRLPGLLLMAALLMALARHTLAPSQA